MIQKPENIVITTLLIAADYIKTRELQKTEDLMTGAITHRFDINLQSSIIDNGLTIDEFEEKIHAVNTEELKSIYYGIFERNNYFNNKKDLDKLFDKFIPAIDRFISNFREGRLKEMVVYCKSCKSHMIVQSTEFSNQVVDTCKYCKILKNE